MQICRFFKLYPFYFSIVFHSRYGRWGGVHPLCYKYFAPLELASQFQVRGVHPLCYRHYAPTEQA